jgi:methyltransferase-like protein
MRDIGPDFGQFDFIIAHGVFSWCPPGVQEKILEICGANLKPAGVAYVSYNIYPGWHQRRIARDILRFHAGESLDLAEQARRARTAFEFYAGATAGIDKAFAKAMQEELETIRKAEDYTLIHDHMERDNNPVLFSEFIERAVGKGLRFLADSEFPLNFPEILPPNAADYIRRFSSDAVRQGQCVDFLLNRFFRRTLLCQGSVKIDREIFRERTRVFYFASDARPDGAVDLNSHSPVVFRRESYAMNVSDPPVKFAMNHLLRIWPGNIHFRDLFVLVRDRFGEFDAEKLLDALPRLHRGGVVDYSSHALTLTTAPSATPLATALARYQAAESENVTNLVHRRCVFDAVHRQVLQLLDGRRDRGAIIASMPQSFALTPEKLEGVLNHLGVSACLQS